MRVRYCISKAEAVLTLEECQAYFSKQTDWRYQEEYAFRSAETVMTLKGDFFIWDTPEGSVPFRYYEGGLYVTVTGEAIYHKMEQIAEALEAGYGEG